RTPLTGSASSAALRRNSAERDDGSPVCSRQASGPCVLRAVLSGIGGDRDLLAAGHQRLVDASIKSVADKNVRGWGLQSPTDDFAVLVLGVQIDPAVRVFLNHFCQLSNKRERLGLIVLRLKRMVGQGRNRNRKKTDADN